MNCPNCGGKTKVQETRSDGETVIRCRKCQACRLRFRTQEIINNDIVIRRVKDHEQTHYHW